MTKRNESILIIDDDEDVLLAAKLLLKRNFGNIKTLSNPSLIPECMASEQYDVIMLDMNFNNDSTDKADGFYWLKRIFEIDPSAIVVMITAYGDVETAVKAIKKGAADFVLKPWQNEKLLATLSASLKLRNNNLEINKLKSKQKQLSDDLNRSFGEFISRSKVMTNVFDIIDKVAKTDANILILGENGTGKEMVARAIHTRSGRSNEVFITVDLGAISETLFESELFGHEKGSFTDAKEKRAGRFEIASGGTLFLDEIGNLSLPLQAKLLTVLQNKYIIKIGSNIPKQIDVRFISASNMPLYKLVEENKFRQDLMYRINTVEINIPPLRERFEDISLLSEHFLNIYIKKYKKEISDISSEASKHLAQYSWPGNIRELQHSIERAVIMNESGNLNIEDFYFINSKNSAHLSFEKSFNLEETEKVLIQKALEKHWGNITHAAKELGLTRTSLYRRMEKYGL